MAESGGIAVHKWWEGQRDPRGNLLSGGKPNVWARKVVRRSAPVYAGKVPGPSDWLCYLRAIT